MGERRRNHPSRTGFVTVGAVLSVISLLSSLYANYLFVVVSHSSLEQKIAAVTVEGTALTSITDDTDTAQKDDASPYCGFRRYPPHRYFQIDDPLPYYKQVKYIHGRWPILLPQHANDTFKVCLHRDNLDPVIDGQLNATLSWPHMEGTNPSLLHIPSRIKTEAPSSGTRVPQRPETPVLGSVGRQHIVRLTHSASRRRIVQRMMRRLNLWSSQGTT